MYVTCNIYGKERYMKMNQISRSLRVCALALALLLCLALPAQALELTRGEAAEIIASAADDYNPGVTASDLIKGHSDGSLELDAKLTRAQLFVMLERAFGGFDAPTGENLRMAIPVDNVTNLPEWAKLQAPTLLSTGIVNGDAGKTITDAELEKMLARVYAYKGTNLKDDFYAAVNKSWLDSSDIPAGLSLNGALYGLALDVNDRVASLITDIADSEQTPGTAQAKIKALYNAVLDTYKTNDGVAPISKYLDAIDSAESVAELIDADILMQNELCTSTLLGFGITSDFSDSDKKMVAFSAFSPILDKTFYLSGTDAQKAAYIDFYTHMLTLAGESDERALADAALAYEAEKVIAAASYDMQEYGDVDKINNIYTFDALQALFPNADLKKVAGSYGVDGADGIDRILVADPGALEAAAKFFDDAYLDTLKVEAKLGLLMTFGATLDPAFTDITFDFTKAYYGIEGKQSPEQIAALYVQSLFDDYLGRAYAEAYFSPEAKADVEEMIGEFIAIYKERIEGLDWLSDTTKAKALSKLDNMKIKVGYPDSWDTYLDYAVITAPEDGGTFFSNYVSILKAAKEHELLHRNDDVDKSAWDMSPCTVNACYSATSNDITFPAAILQSPMYDVNASREENLGAIGYIIAHEITHAFDNNGAKFDENGNAADWWTEEDYAAFSEKCDTVVEWYNGVEAAPGVVCNGVLTLAENVADLGALRCVVEAAKKLDDPDFDKLFRSIARSWQSATTYIMRQYLAIGDVHAPDKLRCNRVLQTLPEFYETYGIKPGDGMWTDPETRALVW